MTDALLTPAEQARGFAAQYAGVFSALTVYLEVRTGDDNAAVCEDLAELVRQHAPIPTYSEYRRKHRLQSGLPDAQTRERVLLDGAVRGLNARIASGLLFTDDCEARALFEYVGALVAFIRGEDEFPGLLDPQQGARP